MFKDSRGRGKYNVFPAIANGQVNISVSYPGTIRAFHRHKNQWDYWYVVKGHIEAVLAGDSELVGTPFYLSEGDDDILAIPPNIWHGFRVLGQEPAILLYFVTNKYDPKNPDEERASYDKFWDWETERK